MNKSIRLLALAIVAVGLTACSKDKDPTPEAKKTPGKITPKATPDKGCKLDGVTSASTSVTRKDDSQELVVNVADLEACAITTFTKSFAVPATQSTEFSHMNKDGVSSDLAYINTLGTDNEVFLVLVYKTLKYAEGGTILLFTKSTDGLVLSEEVAIDNKVLSGSRVRDLILSKAEKTGKSVLEIVQTKSWRTPPAGENPDVKGPQ